MKDKQTYNSTSVRINTTISGEPARWLLEWKRRGIVKSNTDAILQAFRLFQEKITEQDLKKAQLKNLVEIRRT